ncbi:MAG: AAA family ATPase [Candidatus Promineifilaceae bacterium]
MSGHPVYDFLTTELDTDLLAVPYTVQTRWHVLTGAACTGKTTMINQLASLGFETVPETARIHIDRELAKGRAFEDMFGNAADEIMITEMQNGIECGLRAEDVVFLDRALPDSITFYRFCGIDPNEILPYCRQHRYATVFILDRLPFCQDGARLDHDPTSELLDEWLERDYRTLRYDVVRLPVMGREERLAYLLEIVGSR